MVAAKSFSCIFFRNAINNDLSVIGLREGIDTMKKGDAFSIDFEDGAVPHEGNTYHFLSLPVEILATVEDRG